MHLSNAKVEHEPVIECSGRQRGSPLFQSLAPACHDGKLAIKEIGGGVPSVLLRKVELGEKFDAEITPAGNRCVQPAVEGGRARRRDRQHAARRRIILCNAHSGDQALLFQPFEHGIEQPLLDMPHLAQPPWRAKQLIEFVAVHRAAAHES